MSWLVNRLLVWVVDVLDRNLLLGEHNDVLDTNHARPRTPAVRPPN
ncbi:MAG: hypothetical protein QOI01_5788 [Mycobacterium sp.]|jgi:hypothetical protein|nr:hypothetical protein [Mycobacterium sp.]